MCLILMAAVLPLAAQQPAAPGSVIRINVDLVQVDVVVTDKKGHSVPDLKPGDFTILEDGKAQKITTFSYVSQRTVPQRAPERRSNKQSDPPPLPVTLRPDQVQRTIVLLVDDLGLTFEDKAYIRKALNAFVDKQMQPEDLVAIMRTSAGAGALQQFTTDKTQLHAAINRIAWFPKFASTFNVMTPVASPSRPSLVPTVAAMQAETDAERMRMFTLGTLGAIDYVARGLRDLPGRKSIILFSDGLNIFPETGDVQAGQRIASGHAGWDNSLYGPELRERIRQLVDRANRSSVVIDTIDARGVAPLQFSAADNSNPGLPGVALAGSQTYYASQSGLSFLSDQTGGLFVHDSNDLAWAVRKVLDESSAYYLIGYKPRASTFESKAGTDRYHKIHVDLNVQGLHLRSRAGFYGQADSDIKPIDRTPGEQLLAALASPFTTADIAVRLNPLYLQDAAGQFVRVVVQLDANDFTYREDLDGNRNGRIDMVIAAFGDEGGIVGQVNGTYPVAFTRDEFKTVVQNGFLFKLDVLLKKPGAYQIRAAVRDGDTNRIGSASQFIEVPDTRKHRLAVSGLSLANASDLGAMPYRRVFHPNTLVTYTFGVFNPEKRPDGKPDVHTQVHLFRDNKEVFTSPVDDLKPQANTGAERLWASGTLRLGDSLEPGEYVLQLTASSRGKAASNWTAFEVAR